MLIENVVRLKRRSPEGLGVGRQSLPTDFGVPSSSRGLLPLQRDHDFRVDSVRQIPERI